MNNKQFLVIGNDIKMRECAKQLRQFGHKAEHCHGEQLQKNITQYSDIILPLPTAIDGKIAGTNITLSDFCKMLQPSQTVYYGNLKTNPFTVKSYSYCTENFLVKNADLTAQGVLLTILNNIEVDFLSLEYAVLGYGRCGKSICRILSNLTADVIAVTRQNLESFKNNINHYDIIINTIPCNILNDSDIESFDANSIYIEVASKPFGFDNSIISKAKFKNIRAGGLPGKFAPRSAGINIADSVLEIIKEGEYG